MRCFIIFAVVQIVLGDQGQNQCSRQWQDLQKCTSNRQNDYRKTKDLSSSERANIKAKLRLCYTQAGCKDPFPSDREQQARQRCYLQYKDKMKSDLAKCIQASFPEYTVPNDNDTTTTDGQDMIAVKSSTCKPSDKQTFGKCALLARGQSGQNNYTNTTKGKRLDYCQVRCQCYQQSNLTQQCFTRSAQLRDQMCQCQKRLIATTYSNLYRQCMQQQGYPVRNENQDYNLVALKLIGKGGGRFCTNLTDPCGGFRNQQCDSQRSVNNSRQPRASGFDFTSFIPSGGSSGIGSLTSGLGSFFPSNLGSIGGIDTSALGTGTSAGIDPGNAVSGGSLMPDPSSVLSSVTGGSGFDISSFLGNSFDPSSLISSFGGGLSGDSNPFSGILSGMDLSSFLGG